MSARSDFDKNPVWGLYKAGFVVGVMVTSALGGLYQDYLGKEAYTQAVLTHWWPSKITAPIEIGVALIGIIFTIVVRQFTNKHFDRAEKEAKIIKVEVTTNPPQYH